MPYSVAGYSWRSFIVKSAMDSNLLLKNIGQELGSLDPGVEMASSGTLEVRLEVLSWTPICALVTRCLRFHRACARSYRDILA